MTMFRLPVHFWMLPECAVHGPRAFPGCRKSGEPLRVSPSNFPHQHCCCACLELWSMLMTQVLSLPGLRHVLHHPQVVWTELGQPLGGLWVLGLLSPHQLSHDLCVDLQRGSSGTEAKQRTSSPSSKKNRVLLWTCAECSGQWPIPSPVGHLFRKGGCGQSVWCATSSSGSDLLSSKGRKFGFKKDCWER